MALVVVAGLWATGMLKISTKTAEQTPAENVNRSVGATPTGTDRAQSPSKDQLSIPGEGSQQFTETGITVTGIFLDYWHARGEVRRHGFPISPLLQETSEVDGMTYVVQYFERSLLEYHPENKESYQVLLAQLGSLHYKRKYPNGGPNQTPNKNDASFFSETGHWVGGSFWKHWQEVGGLEQLGYPISDEFMETSEFDGKAYTVQYFERSVIELHPENLPPNDVQLAQLGRLAYKQRYNK